MRIAMLTWESMHSIAVGGVATHVSELAAALAARGHELHVFTRQAADQRFHEQLDGVHYHRCPYAGQRDFVDDVNSMCRAMVERVLATEDYIGQFDIVHAHDWLTANALIWIKQGRPCHRTILTIHSTEYARCGNCFPGGASHRVRVQERSGTYWADRVIAVSQCTKGEITWMYEVPPDKVSVVYNGVRPQRFDLSVDPGEIKRQHAIGPVDPTVLFCGRLEWQKGPDLLVEAMPAILRQQPGTHFVFVGDGLMRGSLEARTRQLGVAGRVRFLGQRSGDELVRLYKMADTICVPSRNEPFGIVVLEAWSARRPVVASQVGGPNEYVWHEVNGLKIHPRPDSVAWGVTTMFQDFGRSRWMGANGRQAVETAFTWSRIADQTLAVYAPSAHPAAATPVAAAAAPEVAAPAAPSAEAAAVPAVVALLPAPAVGGQAASPAAPSRPRPRRAQGPVQQLAAELTFRNGTGLPPIARLLDECQGALTNSGCSVHVQGRCLWIEGDCDRVFTALRRCHEAVSRLAGNAGGSDKFRFQTADIRLQVPTRPSSAAGTPVDWSRDEQTPVPT